MHNLLHDKLIQGILLMLLAPLMSLINVDLEVLENLQVWQELGKTVGIWLPIIFGLVKIWHYFSDRKRKRAQVAEPIEETPYDNQI